MFSMSTPYNPAPDPELLPPGPPPLEPAIATQVENPPWTFREVIFLAFIAIFLIAFFQGIAIWMARQKYPQTPILDFARNARVVLPPQVFAYLALLGGMVLLLRSRGVHFWPSIRWNWPRSRWLGFVVLGLVLAVMVQAASVLLPIPKQLPIEKFFADTLSAYMLALFGITLGPLMEELYFRGFLYPVLARRVGMPVAVVITSLSFAFIHASQLAHAWGPLLLLFFVGLALTVARVRTGSVASSFLMHVGYNSTLFIMMYIASDHFRNLDKLK
jgi:membrane protease YdiL (CAAX protease family)